ESQLAGNGPAGKISRGPLLPAECGGIAFATVARTPRRYFFAGAPFLAKVHGTVPQKSAALFSGDDAGARTIQLARKRARTRKCCATRGSSFRWSDSGSCSTARFAALNRKRRGTCRAARRGRTRARGGGHVVRRRDSALQTEFDPTHASRIWLA